MSGHVREGSWRDGPSRLMVLTRFTTNHSSSFDHVVTGHGSVAPSISQHLLRRPRPSVPTVWTSRGPCVDRHITSEGRMFTMDVGLQCNALPRPAQARQARQVGRLAGYQDLRSDTMPHVKGLSVHCAPLSEAKSRAQLASPRHSQVTPECIILKHKVAQKFRLSIFHPKE
jgi:hypothetical protein